MMRTTIRSRRTGLIALFVALAVVILDVALWLLYRDTRRGLEEELARRLENVAAVLAQTLDPGLVQRASLELGLAAGEGAAADAPPVATASDSLRAGLQRIADAAALANVQLYDPAGLGFLDLTAAAPAGARHEAVDPAGVLAALTGSTEHSRLYQSGDDYLMAGYAPVRDRFGVTLAAVAVEADARFFDALERLRNTVLASALASLVVLVGLGTFFARMQASLARADAAVQRAETLAAMGRMAAGIAHEIRNPLGIIKATAARLKKLYDDPAAPDEKFDYIGDEVERLNAIVTGYLHFARDEPPLLERLDLVPLVERSLRLMGPELDAPGVRVGLEAPPEVRVRGDAQRLQQVIMNVVLNAIQAMPQGGRLDVRLDAADGKAHLVFEDSGPGLSRTARERIFEPFFTTKEKGSGLGLTVARRIVEQHGGRIALGDAAGGGARVDIELPAA
jgi:signal transduction histidine kinase